MNIFLLHEMAARILCDKHVIRMPLETAQLLSGVFCIALAGEDSCVSVINENLRVPYMLKSSLFDMGKRVKRKFRLVM